MFRWKSASWSYPFATGDAGRDRNARTLQFACFLLAFTAGVLALLNVLQHQPGETPVLVYALLGFVFAALVNRTGRWAVAGWTGFAAAVLTAVVLVFQARDGFRSLAMLIFPGLVLVSVLLLRRAYYWVTVGIILVAVTALGIADKYGLTHAIPGVRSPTSYESIFYVDLMFLVFALIGSRIARDAQSNVVDLRSGVAQLSAANLELARANEALRQSEERFRSMADAAPVMIWVSAPDRICTFVNKRLLDFTGRSREQGLGVTWAQDVHLEDRDRCLATYNSSCDARLPFEMEYRLRRADGEYRWVLDHGTPLYRGGEFAGFIGCSIDITDQKLVEDRLRANEAQFKDAQRLAKVGSWERYIETERIDMSDEMLRILGLPNDTTVSFQNCFNRVHPKDRESILEASRKARLTGAPVVLEYRVIRPDGALRFVRSIVEAIKNDQGDPVRLAGATQDITEQVEAQDLFRESEQRLKNAERLAHVGNWQWDLNSDNVSWSEEMFHIFGQPRDYTPSFERVLQAVVPQDRQRVERAVTDHLAGKGEFSIEFQIARPNGDVRTIACYAEVAVDKEDRPLYLHGACHDLTELRRAQKEDFARQKLESVGTLANGIAHDFNNLLGGVLAQAELGLGELAAGSDPDAELKAIRDVALRGSEIVRELMIYAGKESAVLGLTDVSQIAEEMLELLKVSVSKHAVLKADLSKDLAAVRANPAQVRQILMNLVTNASEAMGDQDGVIRVTTSCVKLDQDSGPVPDGLAQGDYVQLEVCDTGRGMPVETQAKVFDPFFTTKSAGHGLGLATVHGIVRGLGGAINLTSELGKGTTFQILLRCAETTFKPTSDAISGIEELAPPSREAAVLVVEDEYPLRRAVTKMLRKAGFEVFEAADGSSAIDLLRANGSRIDAILLDMTIPGASSPEVVAEAAKVQPDIRVILTSAYSEEMMRDALSAPQVRAFIRKPFQFEDLVKTLENTLSAGSESLAG